MNGENGNIKVACILDESKYEWFKYECQLIQLNPINWEQVLVKEKPDFLLVQSAWYGYNNLWRGKINNLNKSKDNTIINLVNWCNISDIPTVFWNIDDPVHFENFIDTAKLFEYIFTTDANSIPRYKEILKHNRVYVLPFAAQPNIHNPIDKDKEKLGNVAFAGTWYNIGHEERKKDMEIILKPSLKYDVHIYDRMYDYTRSNYYDYPEIYKPYIKGKLSYKDMCSVYKKYFIFLNVNTVQNSDTMFASRVFELLACGINVISGFSVGIEKMLPHVVKMCKTEEDTLKHLDTLIKSKEIRDRLSLLGEREVFNNHTYSKRFEVILDKIDIQNNNINNSGVSVITCTKRDEFIENIFENFSRQSYVNKEIIIILNNNNMNLKKWKKRARFYNNMKIFQLDEEKSLGQCLNYAIEQSSFNYISKFDDDNYYAPEFLSDLLNAFKYSAADICGKNSYYSYLEESKILAVRFPNMENRYTHFLSGSAFIAKKTIFNKIKFMNSTVDTVTKFFKNCVKNNIRLYSADRFNFAYIRYQCINHNHTWEIEEEEFLRKCEIVAYSNSYIKHVTV